MSHLNRRIFLGAAAAGTVLSPTIASATLEAISADPIFAAIEKHRNLGVTLEATLTEQYRLELMLPKELRQSRLSSHGPGIVETDAAEWIAVERAVRAIHDGEFDAVCEMASVVPTTLAGIEAILSYAAEYPKRGANWQDLESYDGESWSFEIYVMQNCAEAIRAARH